MKTLDEVIKAYDICHASLLDCDGCPYDNGMRYRDSDCYISDALYYLKNYRDSKEWLDLEKRNYAEGVTNCERAEAEYTQMILDAKRNDPLSWQELKQMEGKPVWIEHLCGVLRWGVIDDLFYDQKEAKTKIRFGTRHGFLEWDKADLGNTWQAYRKERYVD